MKISLVGPDLSPDTTLNTYIRDYVHAKGTKYMCQEGGCGACIVAVKRTNFVTQQPEIFAVNSVGDQGSCTDAGSQRVRLGSVYK